MATVIEPKRTLTSEEKKWLLSLTRQDITRSFLMNLWGYTYDTKTGKRKSPKFHTYDEFTLNPKEFTNTDKIVTNTGLYIVNLFLFARFKEFFGYVNEPLNKKAFGKVNDKIDKLFIENKLTKDQYIAYKDDCVWFQFIINTEVSTSLTINSMKELPSVKAAKTEMIRKNKDALASNDVPTATKMEKDLTELAAKELKDDPAMDLYNSGARGGFDSAYKSAQIMKGPVYNETKGQYEVMTRSLMNGIGKEDIPTLANAAVIGQYSKSIAPGECGYITKKLNATFQSVTLDKQGSDCGTKGYVEIELNDSNFKFYNYSYIIEGTKLVRLEPDNKSKYMGKKVKMRSVTYCLGKQHICNKCAGDLYYLIEMDHIGLTVSKLSNRLLNARMKQFHDPTVRVHDVEESDFL